MPEASAPSMMPVSSAVKISVKSITIGVAPISVKISVSRPGGERNFQPFRSSGPAMGLDDDRDS
jgi:hypothetical protein